MLDAEQIAKYQKDGYLVLPEFKRQTDLDRLRGRANAIVEEFDADQHRTIFNTDKQLDHVNRHFLESAHGISCFFEQDAFDDSGQMRFGKALSINKIGHAMHRLDDVFADFSNDPAISLIAQDLGIAEPQIQQSMYIFKQPSIGGEVGWHQDASFFYTDPITVTTFWFALEDANDSNGCLRVQPGGHNSPLRERFLLEDNQARMENISSCAWPATEQTVPLHVKAGTLVCFHGLLPHRSEANRSSNSRHAYTLHLTCGTSNYSDKNWIQPLPAVQ